MLNNNNQTISLVSVVLGIIGTYLAASGKVTPDQWSAFSKMLVDGITALVAAGGLGLAWWNSRKAKLTTDVSQIPGVQVHVDTTAASPAPVEIKALANSDAPAAKDIQPMKAG